MLSLSTILPFQCGWKHKPSNYKSSKCPVLFSARHGHLNYITYLHSLNKFAYPAALGVAIENNHLDVVIWLLTHQRKKCWRHVFGFDLHYLPTETAVEWGRLTILKWLYHHRVYTTNHHTIDGAVCHGHLKVVKFMMEECGEGGNAHMMNWAAKLGYLKIVKYLHKLSEDPEKGSRYSCNRVCTAYAMNNAAMYGHLEIVKFLYYNRSEGDCKLAREHAVVNGQQEVVAFFDQVLAL